MTDDVDLEQGRGLLGRTDDPDQNRYSGFFGYMLSKFEVNPSLDEQEIAREIQGLVGVKFDDKNARHVEDLRTLWTFIYPEESAGAGPKLEDARWKTIGFQSNKPATDFRGGGILSLYCMMYLADKYPQDTRRMIQEAQEEESYYLWACACINVCVQLIFYLRLNSDDMRYQGSMVTAPTITKREVFHVMSESRDYQARDAFGELFSKSMMKLHQIWMEMASTRKVTLLNFGEALDKNLAAIRRACNQSYEYRSVEDFIAIMQVDPDRLYTSFCNYWTDTQAWWAESLASALLRTVNMTSAVEYAPRRF